MKVSLLAEKTAALLPHLRCPLCGQSFMLQQEQSLVCANRHCFDLSAKGYVNLAPSHDQEAEKYDKLLFESRRLVFEKGFYTSLTDLLPGCIHPFFPETPPQRLLDAGCGEGHFLRALLPFFPEATWLGLDLSRDAITIAARENRDAHWLVGNLSHLPLGDRSVQVLLNILTPADYTEFARVLAPEGVLIKVVPGNAYLREIRASLFSSQPSEAYSNQRVLDHLAAHARIVKHYTLQKTFPVTPEEASAFARMTPMTFGLSAEQLQAIALREITIHLEVLVCKINAA